MADTSPPNLLMKFHGSLMVSGWLGTAMMGLIAARYLKQTFVGRKFLGSDVWFALHQSLMLITLLCTVTGVILIWIHVDGWFRTQLHSILGTITLVFTFFQMFALGRPAPDHPKRVYFKYGHMVGGGFTLVVAMAAVFTGMSIDSMQMPQWTKALLYTSYGLFLGTSGGMSLLDYRETRGGASKNNLRQIIFFVFAFVCVGSVLAIVIGIFVDRKE